MLSTRLISRNERCMQLAYPYTEGSFYSSTFVQNINQNNLTRHHLQTISHSCLCTILLKQGTIWYYLLDLGLSQRKFSPWAVHCFIPGSPLILQEYVVHSKDMQQMIGLVKSLGKLDQTSVFTYRLRCLHCTKNCLLQVSEKPIL